MPKVLKTLCKNIRRDILLCSHASGHGHIPTSFSVVELIASIYDYMNHDPHKPEWDERDLFILSKGHAALGFYCVLANFGYFAVEEVKKFGAYQSKFGCHPDRLKVPGVEASTGSLGHGIGLAVGMALALKIQKSSRHVYTLIGDGEANEGTVWEAIMVAVDQKLDNLTVVFDYNHSQTRSLQLDQPAFKFESFGCKVIEINGHNIDEIKQALEQESNQVKVIVADTQKGYGCKTLRDNMFEWHRKSPNAEQLNLLMQELDA